MDYSMKYQQKNFLRFLIKKGKKTKERKKRSITLPTNKSKNE